MAVASPLPVLEHRLATWRRTWRGNVFSSLLLPVLFLLGMGVSVGSYVDRGGALGVPYLDYIAPGLLASTALQIAVAESTWPILGAFEWHRTYHAMRATPLGPADLVGGEFGFLAIRVALPATSFLVVMTLFGVVHSWWGLAVIPLAILIGASLAGAMMAFSATIKSDNMFALVYRFAIIPTTLFAGVFFPVASMPLAARWVAYVSPLWHGVELCRYATLGRPSALPVVVHIGYLAIWAVGGYLLARWRFAVKLAS
jgi:lipooligosaccharide transport system permease protein